MPIRLTSWRIMGGLTNMVNLADNPILKLACFYSLTRKRYSIKI